MNKTQEKILEDLRKKFCEDMARACEHIISMADAVDIPMRDVSSAIGAQFVVVALKFVATETTATAEDFAARAIDSINNIRKSGDPSKER